MKKMLIASIAAGLFLSACSSTGTKTDETQQAASQPSVQQALQECQQTVGQAGDAAAFDACMKSKGFERPAPQGAAPAPAAPASAPVQ